MPDNNILKISKAMSFSDKPQSKGCFRETKVPLLKPPEVLEEATPYQKASQPDTSPEPDRSHRPRLLTLTEGGVNLGKSAPNPMRRAEHGSIRILSREATGQRREGILLWNDMRLGKEQPVGCRGRCAGVVQRGFVQRRASDEGV
jgi:hypothetical protein